MSIQTGFSEKDSISHDGAENRIEYVDEEVQEMPQSVEVSEIGLDIDYSQVGHGFRDRYQFDVLAEGGDEFYRMEVTLTEEADSSYNVRATYAEDDSQVFAGRLEDPDDVVTELSGEVLERRY